MLFQKDNVTLTLVKDGLEHTTLLLTAMVARLGPYLQEFLQNIGNGNIFQEIELKRGHQDLIQFNTTTKPWTLNCIISYLENRFQSIQVFETTLRALLVFDISL